MAQSKCAHYEMIKTKLKQIQAVFVDGNIIESGFEDVVSSADSITEVSSFYTVFAIEVSLPNVIHH